MMRSTKIVATLGPASSARDVLMRMLAAGVDVVRLNFSHGSATDHQERAALVRDVAHSIGREVAIMADLQGPKIRIGKFAGGKVFLKTGQTFTLDATRDLGDEEGVGLDYKELPHDVAPGVILLLNDGLISELRARPAAANDDERRRYYRLTPKGREVAATEALRLAKVVELARSRRLLKKTQPA